jgi:transposase-like protein
MVSLCYRRHRFPPEVIQHAIWLYPRFTLSYRDAIGQASDTCAAAAIPINPG